MPFIPSKSPPSSRAAAVADAGVKTSVAVLANSTVTAAKANVTKLEKQVSRLEYERDSLQSKSRNLMDPNIGNVFKELKLVESKLSQAETKLSGAKAELAGAQTKAAAATWDATKAQWTAGSDFKVPSSKVTLPVTQQQAVASAVEQFKATKNPAEAAGLLQREFQYRPDAEFQAALWNEVKGRVPELAKDPNAMNALVGIAEHGGVDIERDIANALANNAPQMVAEAGSMLAAGQPFVNGTLANLQNAIRTTGRVDLAQRFVEALNKADKPMAASAVAAGTAKELGALRADFVSKQKTVDGLNAKLGLLVGGFGPMMSTEKRQKAIEAFKAKHQGDFAALETAAKKLAQTLPMAAEIVGNVPKTDGEKALDAQAKEVLKLAGPLADTRAGEAALADAMKKQDNGEANWLNTTLEFAQKTKDGEKILGTLGTAVFRKVAIDASKLADSNLPMALSKVESMSKYAKLMGVKPEQAEALGQAMTAVTLGAKGAEQNLKKAVMDLEGTPMIPADGKLSKTLKGVGLALSVVSLAKGGFGEDALDKTKNVMTALNVGADALALGLSIVGRAEAVQTFAKGASSKLGVITGALDLATGYRSLLKGDFDEARDSLIASTGALLMLTPGGQIPGALITVGSVVAGWVSSSRKANKLEAADEADAKAFLVAGGVRDEIAAPLSDLLQSNRRNVGPFLQQLEKHLNLKEGELIDRLNKPEMAGKVRELVTILKAIEPNDDGIYAKRTDLDAVAKNAGYTHGGPIDLRPKSLTAVADWMKSNKMFGG